MPSNYDLLTQSIQHWRRMQKWASKQNAWEQANSIEMWESIEESWFRNNCALCNEYYYDGCMNCPLEEANERCEALSSLWYRVYHAETWADWLLAAKHMTKLLVDLRKKYEPDSGS